MDVTPKERKRILVRMVLILLFFLIVASILPQFLLISGLISAEERILCFSAIILPGLVISGIYASEKFAQNYEESTWGVTLFVTLSVFFGGFLYILYLTELGFVLQGFSFFLYLFLLLLPMSMVIGFFTFEILASRKIKKPFSFHVKRFVGRMVLTEIVFLLIVAISSIINLLAPFLSEGYLITIQIFADLAVAILLYAFTRNPRVGRFFSQLEKGEW
jgi:hypothetical protein